jgi:Na+-transporting methylmalonyl-CoA/oxaloacetate decarboxylase gamma subunit
VKSEEQMTINFTDLYASLNVMWKGMAGLFVVCIFIMLLTMLISRFLMSKGKKGPDIDKAG